MREYILRTDSGAEFDIPFQKWNEVLRPKSYTNEVIQGQELLRLRVVDCSVSFYPEPPGIHVVFECDDISPRIAEEILKEILANAESHTKQKGLVIPLQ